MNQANAMWRVMRQDTLLGTITVEEADFPRLGGSFLPEPAFTQVKPWFDEVLAVMEAEAFDERLDAAHERIARALTLVPPSGPVAGFLLHIDGDTARFRRNDESAEG